MSKSVKTFYLDHKKSEKRILLLHAEREEEVTDAYFLHPIRIINNIILAQEKIQYCIYFHADGHIINYSEK